MFLNERNDAGSSPSSQFKILYVDDEPKALKYFRKALSPELDILTAESVDEAIAILQARHREIGVLATDQRMPEKSGVDLMKIASAQWPDIVIVLITAHAKLNDVIEFINKGRVFQHLSKPWEPDKLKIKMLEALQEYSQQRYNRELAKKNKELQEAYDLQDQFINILSHEIRTPVGISSSLADHLLETPLSPDQAENVKSIKIVSDNLVNLLNNTLDYSKWSVGELKLSSIEFKLDALLEQVSNIFAVQAENADVRYAARAIGSAGSTVYQGDPEKISQILVNLIGNAMKFTPAGGKVLVEARQESERDGKAVLRFSVRDTGSGIDPKTRDQIFKPFIQLQAGKKGTGLGLSICRKFVSRMKGQIDFESEVGKGSEFWFTVQLEKISQTEGKSGSSKSVDHSKTPILLAEDSAIYRMYVSALLSQEGYTVDLAENGQEALDLSREKRYSLILMDCQMPVMDGFETANQIRQNSKNQQTPVIAFTAMLGVSFERKLNEAKISDYIGKPFKTFVFLEMVRHWIENPTSREAKNLG